MSIIANLAIQQRSQFIIYRKRIRIQMGQSCNGAEPLNFPESGSSKVNQNTFSTAEPFDGPIVKQFTESKLLQSRTSCIKRITDGMNQSIRSRLTQLPDFSRLKRGGTESQKRMEDLKANYFGQMQGGLPHGYGALEFDIGDYLQGQFAQGRCEGKGRYIRKDGSYYEGELRNCVADGFGKFCDGHGYKYEGQWKANQPNGHGQAIYSDGSRYNGQFLNNRRHGKGILMQRGCVFEGEFVSNKLEGKATMAHQNGEKYVGQWKQNQKHGKGQYSWPDGKCYTGDYKFGKRQGYGVMSYKNGDKYEGYWEDNAKHGQGKYTTLKSQIRGIWSKGDLLQQRK